MFCPTCGAEFVQGITECPECGVALLDVPPAEPEHDLSRTLTVIERFSDLSQAQLAVSFLRANGIEASLRDQNLVALNWLLTTAVGGIRLAVPSDQEEEARLLLQQPRTDPLPGTDESIEPASGDLLGLDRRGRGIVALLMTLAMPLGAIALAMAAVGRALRPSPPESMRDD